MLISIAFRTLLQARRRSLFLGTALALVTMLLVVLMALSQGITNTLIRAATTVSAGHVVVGGFYKITAGKGIPRVLERDKIRSIVQNNTPGLDYVTDRQRGFGKVVGLTGSMTAGYHGIDIDEEPNFHQVLRLAPESTYRKDGRNEVLGDLSRLREPRTILLFATQAERLGVTVGDLVTLSAETDRGVYNTLDCTVVAVAEDMGMLSSWSTFMPKSNVNEIYRSNDTSTGAVMVYLKDIDQSEEVMAHLREVLATNGYGVMDHLPAPFFAKFDVVAGEDWTGQKLDLTTWEDEVIFLTWIVTAFDTLTYALIAVLLVIIAVGIMNTMMIAVRERTGEIGTLRAIGMGRGQVMALFLLEAGMLGVLGTTAGVLLGGLGSLAVDALAVQVPLKAFQAILLTDTLHLAVTWNTLGRALVIFPLLAGVSAIIPAWIASRLQPVVAMQQA